ncbi:hypothetical protein TNCV_3753371 [Trichonephila clavipes]|nr:hypothetical protein TNCV_3753371 [Trichonephila clavipes]
MSLDLSSMSLDLSSMSSCSASLDLFSMSLDPLFKLFLGDLCSIGACHWTPSSMSLDLRVKTIFGRPLFHWTCPACHWTRPACHWTPVLKLFLGDLCFIGPVQHVIGSVQHVILPVQHVIGPPC